MARLLVVRHAQSEWNALGRWQGWADPPLSAHGRQQAAAAGASLRAVGLVADVVISSDLARAAESASAVAEVACPESQRRTDTRWREFRVGPWSGLTRPEIEQRWPGALDRYDAGDLAAAPGAEPAAAFADRLARALADAVASTPPGGVALVVSHGGSIRAVARLLGYHGPRVGNLSGLLLDAKADEGGDHGPPVVAVAGAVDLLALDRASIVA